MFKKLKLPRNIIGSLIFLVACCVLAFAASVVGISDNPSGIGLAFLSAIALVLTFVHPWRTSKQFRYLIYASGLGLILSVVLHNVFEGIASKVGETSMSYGLLNGTGVAFFFIAILVCPSGLLVGAIGIAIMSIRKRRLQQGPPVA
jgi:membrane protease YdiL (CAAX protease family)